MYLGASMGSLIIVDLCFSELHNNKYKNFFFFSRLSPGKHLANELERDGAPSATEGGRTKRPSSGSNFFLFSAEQSTKVVLDIFSRFVDEEMRRFSLSLPGFRRCAARLLSVHNDENFSASRYEPGPLQTAAR